MNTDDKRLSMSLDEIIRLKDEHDDSTVSTVDASVKPPNQRNGDSHGELIAEPEQTNPQNITMRNHFYPRRNQRPFYNRYSHNNHYEFNYNDRMNQSFPPDGGDRNLRNRGYNRRFRPYRGRPNQPHGYYYDQYNNYRWPGNNRRSRSRSRENLNQSNYLTREMLMKFNNSMPDNGFHSRDWRSTSVFSNRSQRSYYSNRSNNSQRSFHSQRSHRSDRSDRSFRSNRSFGSNSFNGSNHSYRSNRSSRSSSSHRGRRPWMNSRFSSFRRHKNLLNPSLQEEIKKLQGNRTSVSNSVLRTMDFDYTPTPISTKMSLNERFRPVNFYSFSN